MVTAFGMGEGGYNLPMHSSSFSIKVEFETNETNGHMWAVFVYASNRDNIRYEQWQ